MNDLNQMLMSALMPQHVMQQPMLPPQAIGPTSLAHLFRMPGMAAGVRSAAQGGDQAPFDAALQRSMANVNSGGA